ncbi:hypothetical protein [Psychrobacter sp. I-STPA6b]|uniref:hypothetical protein n=1 Tax=Psychrobacter sp. I-STPA6b TaxID=2585718 RepID=UPI001D0C5406|nr:hypothetical protein [Psychrobacter sp. I-STPA6b]
MIKPFKLLTILGISLLSQLGCATTPSDTTNNDATYHRMADMPVDNAMLSSPSTATVIHFASGAISQNITGKLLPQQDAHWYQFSAQQGQYAIINLTQTMAQGATEIANVADLHFPDGGQDGNKGGIIYQGCLPQTGNYRLRIARNLMATHGGIASYHAEVIVLPRYASQSLCSAHS